MSLRAKCSGVLAVVGSLTIATTALAAQPISNGRYAYGGDPTTHGTAVILTMQGKHQMDFEFDCGAPFSAASPAHPRYLWDWQPVTVKSDGSFSFRVKTRGMKITQGGVAGRRSRNFVHGRLRVSGKFTSSTLATGTATAGKCTAHFRADYSPLA